MPINQLMASVNVKRRAKFVLHHTRSFVICEPNIPVSQLMLWGQRSHRKGKKCRVLIKKTLVFTFLFTVNNYCQLPICFVSATSSAGTDVMLLDNFSTDGSSHPQHHGNLSGKRRSSVTFEDQVEHSKGMCHFPAPQRIREKGGSLTSVNKQHWKSLALLDCC